MKKYAFLFPGQGAQVPGMIKDICEKYSQANSIIEQVSSITNVDMKKLLWESDSSVLNRSDNSQLAITTASIAVMNVLESKEITPCVAMGFSLGEFPALYASGVLSFEDVIKVVFNRGKIMQEVCEKIANENQGHAPGMSAIIGLTPEQVLEIENQVENVYAANFNSIKQTVISGTFDGLEKAEVLAKSMGARRALRLSVAGPFHCPLMKQAADNFEKAISNIEFKNPNKILFSNVTGKQAENGEEIKKNAVLHLTNPVRWTSEEDILGKMINEDKENEWQLIEPGVGNVLTGLWGKTDFSESLKCLPINCISDFDNL